MGSECETARGVIRDSGYSNWHMAIQDHCASCSKYMALAIQLALSLKAGARIGIEPLRRVHFSHVINGKKDGWKWLAHWLPRGADTKDPTPFHSHCMKEAQTKLQKSLVTLFYARTSDLSRAPSIAVSSPSRPPLSVIAVTMSPSLYSTFLEFCRILSHLRLRKTLHHFPSFTCSCFP